MAPEEGTRGRGAGDRLRSALAYAGFLLLAGAIVLAVVDVVFGLLPDHGPSFHARFVDGLLGAVGWILGGLAVVGLVAGWFLGGGVRRAASTVGWHPSARMRLTLSYAGFLLIAGAATLFGVYVVLRYVPDYPLTAADPTQGSNGAASRGEILEAVVEASGWILGGLAVVGLAGGWLLAGRVLRPLRALNEAARVAATGRLDHRVRLAGRTDEFGELADSFDHMLDRLEDAFLTQQRFAANASHELRTPLAVTETLIEAAQAAPEETDQRQLLERLAHTNRRAIDLTEALLRLSDANAINAALEPFDLGRLTRTVTDDFVEEARRRGVTLEPDLRRAPTAGDVALIEQLIANLTQNAIRHNHAEGVVLLSTRHDPAAGDAVLRVENTGTRYSPEVAAQLAEPFMRGSGRTTRGEEDRGHGHGHGLGLALVERIAGLHHGTLKIVPRDGGGLITTVSLPAER